MNNKFTIIIFLLFSFSFLIGQKSVNFQKLERPYVTLTDGVSITDSEVWDDLSFQLPIPIRNEFMSSDTVIYAMFESLGSDLFAINLGGELLWMVPIFFDLIDRGYLNDASLSDIITGIKVEPSGRSLVFEWRNAGFYDELQQTMQSKSYVNYQIIIPQDQPYIEFHYGESNFDISDKEFSLSDNGNHILGMAFGNSSAEEFTDLFIVEGNNSSAVLQRRDIVDGSINTIGYDGYPTENTVFRFSLPGVSTKELFAKFTDATLQPTLAQNHIEVVLENNEMFSFSIVNVQGQSVLSGSAHSSESIDISGLNSGNYFINIQEKGKLPSPYKFVKL